MRLCVMYILWHCDVMHFVSLPIIGIIADWLYGQRCTALLMSECARPCFLKPFQKRPLLKTFERLHVLKTLKRLPIVKNFNRLPVTKTLKRLHVMQTYVAATLWCLQIGSLAYNLSNAKDSTLKLRMHLAWSWSFALCTHTSNSNLITVLKTHTMKSQRP